MRILHTSDWHLGQSLYDFERTAEERDMLGQIREIVRLEQPDAMVVSGDVFHTGNPTTSAVEMYNAALLGMHEACPSMQIVVTAGNHDSASRLVVNNTLWDYFRVSVVGHVARRIEEDRAVPDYESHIVAVKDTDGEAIGYIAAVPHCYEPNFPTENPDTQRNERMKSYFRGLLAKIREKSDLPVVLMAHLAVSGCDLAGHDNIGGMETRDHEVFGDGFDYVALGHIHTPQNITDRIRYCGTPIPVNFGERFEHSVSIVTVTRGELPKIETRRIKNLIPLHDFPSEPAPFAEVLERIKGYDDDELCYLRVLIKEDETMTPLANTLLSEAIKGKRCRLCRIQIFRDETEKERTVVSKTPTRLTGDDLSSKTPLEIAELFFRMKGMEMTDRQREMIKDATAEAEEAKE